MLPRSWTSNLASLLWSGTSAASGACAKCQKLVQAPGAPRVIDKGVPTAGLLAQVLVGKFADHLPL
jgi:transposase